MEERKDSEPTEEFSDHSTEEQVEEYEDLSEEEEVEDHGFGESQLEMDRSEEEQVEEEKNESEEVEEEDYYEVIEEYIEQECSEEGYSGEEYIEEVIEEESVEEGSDHEEMDSKKTRHAGKEQQSMTSVSLSHCADSNYEVYTGKSGSVFCKKKRKLDLDLDYKCKKYKQEISPKPNSDSGPTDAYHRDSIEKSKKIVSNNVSKEHGSVGSSDRRKRSRWDLESENPEALSCNDEVTKRKKTRWASDENQLKMLGPLHLPDLTKSQDCAKHDPVIQGLNEQLMKINEKLLRPEIADNQTEKRSPSPVPVYNDMGIKINTREMRLRAKLAKRKAKIISKLVCRNLQFALPQENTPLKFHKKLYVPVKEYPEVNFVGLIIGPRGNTLKRMEIQTGSRIFLRGKGSTKEGPEKKHKKAIPSHTDNDDLHVLIEADNQKSLDAAVEMVEKLLVPLEEVRGLKMAQLRELAMLNGKIKSNSCDTCGDAGHLTSYCPLTAPAPGKKTEGGQSIDLLGELKGQALFSFSNGQGPLSTSSGLPTKETDSANLYVGYLPQSVDGAALRQLFCSFGTITSLKVVKDHATGRSKGYGFVTYDNPASAARAVEHMNRFQIGDKRLVVRVAGPPPAATAHNAGSVRPNSVGFLPVYTGPSPIPEPMPDVVGLSGPPLLIMPGSCSYFPPQNGNTFTHYPSPDPAVLPGQLVSMTPVSCTYLLQTTAGTFSHGDHLMWPPPASYVPYSAPVVLPSVPSHIFTPSEFANFPGNPDKFDNSESQSSLFSTCATGDQLPDSKVARIRRNPNSPTSAYHSDQVAAPWVVPPDGSSRGATNYPAKVDYGKGRFYG